MRIVEVLEDEHEEDEDDGGERPGDPLHDGGAGGGVEDVGEEPGQRLDPELDEEDVETQQTGLDVLDGVPAEVRHQAGVGDDAQDAEDGDREEEAQKVEEPHPDLLDEEGHHEEHEQADAEDDEGEEVVEGVSTVLGVTVVATVITGSSGHVAGV